MSKAFHILMLEPSVVIREGLGAVLEKSGQPFEVSAAGLLAEVLPIHTRRHCDVVLINPALVQFNVREFQSLRHQMPATRWIGVVYAYYERDLVSAFDDILTISDPPRSILALINKHLLPEGPQSTGPDAEMLSEREMEVLKWVASGRSNKEIADRLHISINTVVTHRKNISQKTGIKSVSGLTIFAVVKGIISLGNIPE